MKTRENVFIGDLSGGEQKRLSIATELVENPKILFLDECTTGLDSCTSTQTIQLLKKMAMQGRTIICTIHQPCPIIFTMFDYVYGLAGGKCIYMGSSHNLIQFFTDLDLECPSTYSPADFLLEIANNDYGEINNRLTDKIFNGNNSDYRNVPFYPPTNYLKCDNEIHSQHSSFSKMQNEICELLKRNFLNNYRDKTLTLMRIGIHIMLGLFIGVMYQGIGQEASNIINIYKYLFFSVFVLMFTAFSSLQTVCKLTLIIIPLNFNFLQFSSY